MKFETKAIHMGQEPDEATGSVVVPIFQTSTYAQSEVGVNKGHEYSRTSNPTRDALETCVASLEGGKHGFAFASGMAAISTILTLFRAGDHIVSSNDVYGGTYRVFDKVMRDFGLDFTFVDTTDEEQVAAELRPETRMVWVESPTNPTLRIADLKALARLCTDKGVLLGVDNTFMSPFFQRPLELGADLVMHSSTKYLAGHSDVIGGAVVTDRDDVAERLGFSQNAVGAIPGPFDSWLTLRGVKTLAVRMERHASNAMAVASFLDNDPRVRSVLYPGLESHPGHELQSSQGDGFGGMLSFYLEGGLEEARRFCSGTKLFILAESLGGVESLVEHPAIMTHASVPEEVRRSLGIDDNFVRLSVGIENVGDLLKDLDNALGAK